MVDTTTRPPASPTAIPRRRRGRLRVLTRRDKFVVAAMLGIPLPTRWFQVSARVDMHLGRYHFLIDSSLSGVGRIVRYEGFLDASP